MSLHGSHEKQENCYLTFYLGEVVYALKISQVIAVEGVPKTTKIPGQAGGFKGFASVRAEMVPVYDLRELFGEPEPPRDKKNCLIILENKENYAGLLVEQIGDVVEIPATQIEPPHRVGRSCNNGITGVAKIEHSVVILLDAEQLLVESQGMQPCKGGDDEQI